MKKPLLILAAGIIASAPVAAADLGWGGGAATAPASLFSPTSTYDWSGFYLGINGGYGWGQVERTPAGGGASVQDNTGGWSLGGQAGYNFDFGGFVLGAEADAQWASLRHHEDRGGAGSFETGIDAYGSARLRAGASFGQVMPYVTGGFAAARGHVGTTDAAGVVSTQSQNHFGWVLGGGLEAAATENVTFRAEYLHYSFGAQSYATGGGVDAGHSFNVVRAGLNYKF